MLLVPSPESGGTKSTVGMNPKILVDVDHVADADIVEVVDGVLLVQSHTTC